MKSRCQVDLAPNGVEAVALHRQQHYNLIFMDDPMPEMNGFDATTAIRGQEQAQADLTTQASASSCPPSLPRTPIIALSASVMAEDQERCFQAGMDDFLSKSINSAELNNAFTKWMGANTQRMAAKRSLSF